MHRILASDTPLSFWGGVDPYTGRIIDQHHPLAGECVTDCVFVLPTSRGSCSGSGVLLELLSNGCAPAALVFRDAEEILTIGAIVARELFDAHVPVYRLPTAAFDAVLAGNATVSAEGELQGASTSPLQLDDLVAGDEHDVALDTNDQAMIDGENGEAARIALRIILRACALQGAASLLNVSRAHIDACIYSGPASLQFAERLVERGATVAVPTTLNSLSVDKRHWREHGVDAEFGSAAAAVGDAYLAMGARVSFTCAPYLLDDKPVANEQIGWAESNAVVFANTVLGARTQKYPDFLDVCIAITGRAPAAGCHLDEGRKPGVRIAVESPPCVNDAFWPVLGHHIGELVGHRIPLITGLEHTTPSQNDLKAFCAAFATTSASALCHIAGTTPEAHLHDATSLAQERVTGDDLSRSYRSLSTATDTDVDLVCIGNPHCSLEELSSLAALCKGRRKHVSTGFTITLGRDVHAQAVESGIVDALHDFGVRFITDTCWCMVQEPVIPREAQVLMTNSAKYAHYGPGLVGRPLHFGSLAACVEAACCGVHEPDNLFAQAR